MYQTLSGSYNEVMRSKGSLVMDNAKVEEIKYEVVEYNGDNDSYVVMVVKVTPYTPEELQEISVYGNSKHEDYLCSEEYYADCKSEQWDWLKNA